MADLDKTSLNADRRHTILSICIREGRDEIAKITSLAELNAVREVLGTSISADDLTGIEKEEWDLLMDVIKRKLAEFGVECDDDSILLGQFVENDTIISAKIRAARLSIASGAVEVPDDINEIVTILKDPKGFNDLERTEWDALLKVIEDRKAEIAKVLD